MDEFAAILAGFPSVLVGAIPLRGSALAIGDPYFLSPDGLAELPMAEPAPARPSVYVVRADVPGWGKRNLAAWLRLREDRAPGRLEPLGDAFGPKVFQSDTGLGAYADRLSLEAFIADRAVFQAGNTAGNYHGERLAPLLRLSAERAEDEWDVGSRALYAVPGAADAALAIFQCGLGGGGFASWLEWAGDELVGVATDFAVLEAAGITLDQLVRAAGK